MKAAESCYERCLVLLYSLLSWCWVRGCLEPKKTARQKTWGLQAPKLQYIYEQAQEDELKFTCTIKNVYSFQQSPKVSV